MNLKRAVVVGFFLLALCLAVPAFADGPVPIQNCDPATDPGCVSPPSDPAGGGLLAVSLFAGMASTIGFLRRVK